MIISYGLNILFSVLLLFVSDWSSVLSLVSNVVNMAITFVYILFLYRSEIRLLADSKTAD